MYHVHPKNKIWKININRHEGALIWDNQIMEVKGPQPGTEFRLMQVKGH